MKGQVADTALIDWVTECVLPHEGAVRAWLGRAFAGAADPEDVVQEAYCRLLALAGANMMLTDQPEALLFYLNGKGLRGSR